MQTMTTFYRDISNCSDDELLELCKQCMFARQYGYFEPKSVMHKYMCDIICSESQRRCGSTVMLDMIITVGNELMRRFVEENKQSIEEETSEEETQEKDRHYLVSYQVQYADGQEGFCDATLTVAPDQKFTRELLNDRNKKLAEQLGNGASIVVIGVFQFDE